MKLVLILLFTYFILVLTESANEWEMFKKKYGKVYSPEEDEFRKNVFMKTLKEVLHQSRNFQTISSSFKVGLNAFSDMTDREFAKLSKSGVALTLKEWKSIPTAPSVKVSGGIPDSVNWVAYGFNTTVMDQGVCGCCYAMASTATVEGHYFIKHKTNIKLSQQEIIDCSQNYGNKGCKYGYMLDTFKYIKEKGIGPYDKDPYQAIETNCEMNTPRYFITDWFRSESGNETSLMEAVAKGPVVVIIYAELPSFRGYKEGLYNDPKCRLDIFGINHFVTVVGYGTTADGQPHWLIKNSWGSSWGMNGYMYMARNINMCGITTQPIYPEIS